MVLGAPGTGKTTLLVELVAARINAGLDPASVLALSATRRGSLSLRDRIVARVGRTIREPLARTAHSYAFGLLRQEAARRGDPAPRLLGAAEQDVMITELLAGSSAPWPDDLAAALRTRHFARSLRDLLLRAVERDVSPTMLTDLGRVHGRPDWVAAGDFAQEYAGVTALAQPSSYDAAELVRAAVTLLHDDPDLRDRERRTRALVVVDDLDEADAPMLDLLEVLAGDGGDLVVTADPDSTVLGFRGADPQAVRTFPDRFPQLNGAPAPTVVLRTGYRLPEAASSVVTAVAGRLGGSGLWRGATAAPGDGRVDVRVLASPADELAHVAAVLRRRHLVDGVSWHDMAVVARSSADLAGLRRALTRHGVPVDQRRDEVALWQQPPVRALLDLLALCSGHAEPSADTVVDLLLGPLGSLDPAGLARLRRDVLRASRVSSGEVDAMLAAAVVSGEPVPGDVADPAVASLSATVRAGRAALLADGSVEAALWALWDSVGVAGRWRTAALGGGRDGAAADRDLDAVVALFQAAADFVDRLPGAGSAAFLDHVGATSVPGSSWSVSAPAAEAVAVLTAHGTKGMQWDTVAVCRVQEERWPDVRRRETLLGADELVAVTATGRLPTTAEKTSALLAAERRLFHLAVSRARSDLLVTAVEDEDHRPSRFLDDVAPGDAALEASLPDPVLDMPSLVAELRAVVCTPQAGADERAEAARLLALLAHHGVPGSHPDGWYGLAPVTEDGPLSDPGSVRLSPSQVEAYLRCPLRWMLQRAGGDDGAMLRRSIGALVHQVAFEATTHDWDEARILARFDELWATIDAGRGWVARRERSRVEGMVRRLSRWLTSQAGPPVAAETEVEVDTGPATIRGRVDRVDRAPDGSMVVVDFKTGTSVPTVAEAAENPQLAVYQWAIEQGALGDSVEPRAGGGLLVNLGAPGETARVREQPALRDSDDPEWPRQLVDEVTRGASGAAFAAYLNPGCGGCPVRTSCPAQPAGGQVAP